ncbi:MAG: OmpA family protein [Myxococcales bacterium]|nr:OmpA family protein [Myxococcales bacterium]
MILLATWAASATAADVDTFVVAGSLATGTGTLQGESPHLSDGGLSGGLSVGFSADPVVRLNPDDSRTAEVTALVPVHLQGSWTIEDMMRVDVLVPVYAWVDAPLTDFSGAALGDVRLQSTVAVWDRGTTALALVPRIDLPTGRADALVAGGLNAGLVAALGGRVGRLGWVTDAGISLAQNQSLEAGSSNLGSRATGVAGAWWHLTDAVRFGAEVDLTLGLARGEGSTNNTSTAHGFAQAFLPSGLGFVAGAGTGLVSGVGTPQFHLFGAITFAPVVRDRDGDGLADGDDACAMEAEDVDGFDDEDGCPDPDNDGDQVRDADDGCPLVAEDVDGFDDEDGCPDEDNDDDGIDDDADACPDVGGTLALAGCPDADSDGVGDADDACPELFGEVVHGGCPDTDRDGISDDRDACPQQPKRIDEDVATSDGCPKDVWVTADQIKIDHRVEFETGRHVLRTSSFTVLDGVAEALRGSPQVRQVEIQGHTDNVGPADFNRRLSQQRAEAVRDYLVERGVDATRLQPRGYGESTPLFTNRTESGREANRRVQFVILDVE